MSTKFDGSRHKTTMTHDQRVKLVDILSASAKFLQDERLNIQSLARMNDEELFNEWLRICDYE